MSSTRRALDEQRGYDEEWEQREQQRAAAERQPLPQGLCAGIRRGKRQQTRGQRHQKIPRAPDFLFLNHTRTLHFHIYVVIGSGLHGGREQRGKETKANTFPARLVPADVPSAASYEEGKLCLELGCGTLTVYGDDLKIETLSARRLTLRGQILRTDFSKE